jgi:hypothetical protein
MFLHDMREFLGLMKSRFTGASAIPLQGTHHLRPDQLTSSWNGILIWENDGKWMKMA